MGLGLVGVGLPDIPLFLGVVLRGVYQIALSYGIDYRTPPSGPICWPSSTARPRRTQTSSAPLTNRRYLYAGAPIPIDEQALRRRAAESLAEGMLTAKFVQGLPLVGAAGGAYNLPLYRRITGYAETQYRKTVPVEQELKKDCPSGAVCLTSPDRNGRQDIKRT